MLFVEHQDFVWALIASLYVANVFALLINLLFIPGFGFCIANAVYHPRADHLRALCDWRVCAHPVHARCVAHVGFSGWSGI